MGHVISAMRSAATPRSISRRSNFTRFVTDPISPKYAKSSRRMIALSQREVERMIVRRHDEIRARRRFIDDGIPGKSVSSICAFAGTASGKSPSRASTHWTTHGSVPSTFTST